MYWYGMKLRGFSPGCQPMEWLEDYVNVKGKYHSLLVYHRELSEEDIERYELEFIGEQLSI